MFLLVVFCCLGIVTVHLTTPHFKTSTPMGAQMGPNIFVNYVTWVLGMKNGNCFG